MCEFWPEFANCLRSILKLGWAFHPPTPEALDHAGLVQCAIAAQPAILTPIGRAHQSARGEPRSSLIREAFLAPRPRPGSHRRRDEPFARRTCRSVERGQGVARFSLNGRRQAGSDDGDHRLSFGTLDDDDVSEVRLCQAKIHTQMREQPRSKRGVIFTGSRGPDPILNAWPHRLSERANPSLV
jgi:hypothetical protein